MGSPPAAPHHLGEEVRGDVTFVRTDPNLPPVAIIDRSPINRRHRLLFGAIAVLGAVAWAMIAYPMLLAVQRLSSTGLGVALIGGWFLMTWDFFLDPQMVGEGYWTWNSIGWELPGIDGIPLQNFLGWWLGGIVLMFALDRLPRKSAHDAVPNTLLLWTYASNILAAAVFFGRPGVAIWGALGVGVVVIPWAWKLWSQPQW